MSSREKLGSDFISIVVADSTRIHTELLAEALRQDCTLQVVAAVSNSEEFEEAIARVPVDVVVISHNFSNHPGHGAKVLREMRAARPKIKGVILLDSANPDEILECFRAGARGIFSKQERLESLCKCIHSVHQGQIWARSVDLDHALAALASTPAPSAINSQGVALLSVRERQVVQQVAAGLSNREIAQALGLSAHTVKNYLFRIFDKLGVSSRTELLYLTMSAPTQATPAKTTGLSSVIEAAEAGFPSAQLRLAEHFSQIREVYNIKDSGHEPASVSSYTWYLLAEKATAPLLQRIEEGKDKVRQKMSPRQIAEAEERAAAWARTTKKHVSNSTDRFESEDDKDDDEEPKRHAMA
jgi:DNA-binding NarL/FixJ family response regulator